MTGSKGLQVEIKPNLYHKANERTLTQLQMQLQHLNMNHVCVHCQQETCSCKLQKRLQYKQQDRHPLGLNIYIQYCKEIMSI